MKPLRSMSDQELDDYWNIAIAEHNDVVCMRCELELSRRQAGGTVLASRLVADLEQRLAERAGKPRSRPTTLDRVDFGAPSARVDDPEEKIG